MLFSKKTAFLSKLGDVNEVVDFKYEQTNIVLEKSAVALYFLQTDFTFAEFIDFSAEGIGIRTLIEQ